MPNVPTYIKGSDLDKYLAIHAKGRGAWSEFIHNALNVPRTMQEAVDSMDGHTNPTSFKPIKTPKVEGALEGEVWGDKVIKSPKDAEKAVGMSYDKITKKLGLCKIHGTPLTDNGKCLIKKCKYS